MNTVCKALDLLKVFRTKLLAAIDFTEVDARTFTAFQCKDQEPTWKMVGDGIAWAGVDGTLLLEMCVDLGPCLRQQKPVDLKISESVSRLIALIPTGAQIHLSLQSMNQRDADCAQVKICIEAKP